MDHFIDAINMSLHSPNNKIGLKLMSAPAVIDQRSSITKENIPSTNRRRDQSSSILQDGSGKRARAASEGCNNRATTDEEQEPYSSHMSNLAMDYDGSHEKNDTNTISNKSTTFNPKEFITVHTTKEVSLDSYDHILDEADSLLRSFEILHDEMKYISIKNVILMDQLASLGLEL